MHSQSRPLSPLATNPAPSRVRGPSEAETRILHWVRKPVYSAKTQPSTSVQSFSISSTGTSTPRPVDSLHLLELRLRQWVVLNLMDSHAADHSPAASGLSPIPAGREPYNLA